MKTAEVSELKAHLSDYLRKVRGGEIVEVLDRCKPIARLVPVAPHIEEPSIRRATSPASAVRNLPSVRLKRRPTALRMLRASRQDRF